MARPTLVASEPLHVTVRLRRGLPSAREQALLKRIRLCIGRAQERFEARIVHYSVQRDHLHLIMEAVDRRALSRAMRGIGVRIARGVNGVLGCEGRVMDDRYHARPLTSPREVHTVLRYVLLNTRHHGTDVLFDRASSCAAFGGWTHGDARDHLSEGEVLAIQASVADPQTWLARDGWRCVGLLDPTARPGPR